MRKITRKWNMDVLSQFSTDMYETLLHEHNIITDTMKEIEFDDVPGWTRGYFAKKDKKKYWIQSHLISQFPLKLGNEFDECKYNEDLIFMPTKPIPFKILPQLMMGVRDMIDEFVPFKHTNPDHWMLMKFLAIMGYVGRTYTCQSTNPGFGKSSCYDVLHYITDKNPVFQPRSVPGVLNNLNTSGNIVFDEVHKCKKEVRDIMENMSLLIGGGKSMYINGALKSANTKSKYNCALQSMTFIYNTLDCYQDSEDFFDSGKIWSNPKAMDDRFLKFKLDGVFDEEFNKNFDIIKTAKTNKMFYINFAKTLLYLQELKVTNGYQRKYVNNGVLQLKGRRGIVYKEISWLIDMYCETQSEYDDWIKVMDYSIISYREMIGELPEVTEEVVR